MKRADKSQTLTAQEIEFVEAVMMHTTLKEAAEASGQDYGYARHLRHKPHIAKAINDRCAELEAEHCTRTQRVLIAMARKGEAGDTQAAAVYLRAVGRGMSTNVVTQVSVGVETDSDFEQRTIRAREAVLAGIASTKDEG